MRAAHQGAPVAGLPGSAPSFASAIAPTGLVPPPAAVGGHGGAQASAPAGGATRPAPIDPSLDGWFLDRLFGRR